MVEIKTVRVTDKFDKTFRKLKDRSLKDKLIKQIEKVKFNPNFGKPLTHDLKGEKTIYVKPYRMIYKLEGDILTLLRFEHRKKVYE